MLRGLSALVDAVRAPALPLPDGGRLRGRIHTATDGRDILLNDPDGWEVEQPWLWWQGPAGGDGTDGPWGNPPPGADGAALLTSMPAVTRCTSIICDTIAGLPWRIMRGYDQQITPDWIGDPQALRVDRRVVSEVTTEVRLSAVEFWAQWIVAALWFGDGFVYVPVRDKDGAPRPPLWQLHPHAVTVQDGRYFVEDIELPAASILHLRGAPPYLNGRGSGVVDRHALDLQLASTIRQYASSVFATGVPAGYLKVNAPNVTVDQAADLKRRWLEQHGGIRKSIAVLNATTEFVPLTVTPVDAQLDVTRTMSLRDVALAFGVPPYMLGVPGDSSTYANVESRMIELRTFTLLPWIRRVESVLDSQFPRGTEVKIATDATLRADTATRFAAYEAALRSGFMTVDEVRAMEDRPPLPAQVTTDPSEPTLPPAVAPMGEVTP